MTYPTLQLPIDGDWIARTRSGMRPVINPADERLLRAAAASPPFMQLQTRLIDEMAGLHGF